MPGTHSRPPLLCVCSVTHAKAWIHAKPGCDQGFWSQWSQFSSVRHCGASAVGRITPQRGVRPKKTCPNETPSFESKAFHQDFFMT